MRTKRYWISITVLVSALIILGVEAQAFAGDLAAFGRMGKSPIHDQQATGGAITLVAASDQEKAEMPKDQGGQSVPDESGPSVSDSPDEVTKLKVQIIELQNKGKLGFRKVVACSAVEGYGSYSPLTTGESLTKIAFYCEPANVSTLISGDRYVIDCAVDVFLTDLTGKLLLGKQGIVKLNRVGRSPILDLYFPIQIDLQKLPVRQVIAKIVLHDKIKNQSVSVGRKVEVHATPKKQPDKI
jgi:hypothetical protein